MELQERRRERGLEQADLAKRIGTNAPMMSNFENYKCLPVPKMLAKICEELHCTRQDIYSDNELYVLNRKGQINSTERAEPEVYKLSVRLPDRAREMLTQENLEKCGYHSLKDYIWHCYLHFERLVKRAEAKEKATKHQNCSVANEIGI